MATETVNNNVIVNDDATIQINQCADKVTMTMSVEDFLRLAAVAQHVRLTKDKDDVFYNMVSFTEQLIYEGNEFSKKIADTFEKVNFDVEYYNKEFFITIEV